MREIKFRGKRVDNGEWVYGYYHSCVGDGIIWLPGFKNMKRATIKESVSFNNHWILVPQKPDSGGWTISDTFKAFSVDPETVGQFTGLHDKNNNEIYEGDTVRTVIDDEYGERNIDEVVEFNGAAFYPICQQPGNTYEIIFPNQLNKTV